MGIRVATSVVAWSGLAWRPYSPRSRLGLPDPLTKEYTPVHSLECRTNPVPSSAPILSRYFSRGRPTGRGFPGTAVGGWIDVVVFRWQTDSSSRPPGGRW